MTALPGVERTDLHLHTIASDGVFTPQSLIAACREVDLRAIAVTDHDTVDGVEACIAEGALAGVEVAPGVEVSCRGTGRELHLVGLFVDFRNADLLRLLGQFREGRRRRVGRYVESLAKHGVRISAEDVFEAADGGSPGRPHVAEAMVRGGWVSTSKEAFDRYIGDGCPCYVAREKVSLRQAADLIHGAGGVSILAHPACVGVRTWTPELVASGVQGVEVYSPQHSADDEATYRGLADRHQLLVSGGSDCHGRTPDYIRPGSRWLPYEDYCTIRDRSGFCA